MPGKLMQSSRANLMLQGLLPNDSMSVEQLEELIVEGRMCEIRMLFYVGKDLLRWAGQCTEVAERHEHLRGQGLEIRSFISALVEDTPPRVRQKLTDWGVQDYRAIFQRAVGMDAIFSEPPDRLMLAGEFIRNYHYYADRFFDCWIHGRQFPRIRSKDFPFELYASGEYSRLLERQWSDKS